MLVMEVYLMAFGHLLVIEGYFLGCCSFVLEHPIFLTRPVGHVFPFSPLTQSVPCS